MNLPVLPLFRYLEEPNRRSTEAAADSTSSPDNSPNKETSLDSTKRNRWVPSWDSVNIAGREIGGMVYIGEKVYQRTYGTKNYGSYKSRAYIDPSLPVAKVGTSKDGNLLSFWPAYWEFAASHRATYLDWLATGRSDASFGARYVLLFIYGLACRFALDNPPVAEKREILEEAMRLKNLHRKDRIYLQHLDEFIQFGRIALGDIAHIKPVHVNHEYDLPLRLKVAVGARIAHREPLSADWAFSWFLCHPNSRLRLSAERCRDEFAALFKLRYNHRFPKGLRVKPPQEPLVYDYLPAPGEPLVRLPVKFKGKPVHNIARLRKAVEIAQEIADGAMNELERLSRYLASKPDGHRSLEARALMPSELWHLFPCKELKQLKIWARGIESNGGLVSAGELVARLEGAHPGKITKKQLMTATTLLAQIGFGFAPDPQFSLRPPKIEEPVVVFDTGEVVARIEDVSDTYREVLLASALGVFVAHSDGEISESERASLRERASQAQDLGKTERRRLLADLNWMLTVPPSLPLLRRRLKGVGPDTAAAIRATLVSTAHADGVIVSEEVAAIEKIYKTIGLDPSFVYSDLHAAEVNDGLVKVRSAKAAAHGENIPAEGMRLDTKRIDRIRSDTVRVSSVLGEIFDDAAKRTESEDMQEVLLPGLDARYAAFVKEIINKDHWTERTFGELCVRFSLMASGAMEHINEWAYEVYDDALLEEYDGYDVNSGIADALNKVFEREHGDVQAKAA